MKNNNIYKNLIENSNDLNAIIDTSAKFVYQSPSSEEILGYQPSELVGKQVSSFINHDDLEKIQKAIGGAIKNPGKMQKAVYRFKHKNGSWVYLESHGKAIKNDNGNLQLLVNSRDITERMKSEELLKSNEKRLQEAQTIAHVGSWHYDVATDKTEWSPEVFHIFGADPLLSSPGWKEHRRYIHSDDWARVDGVVTKAMREGKPYKIEFRIVKNKSIIWALSIGSASHNTKGRVISLQGTVQDITEQKKEANALRESEERLRLNVENTPVAIIDWDKDFQVVAWNPSAERIFGYTKKEAMGKHANFIIPKEVRPFVDDVWEKLLAGKITQVTNENITKDGKRVIIEWHNTPLKSADGDVFGVSSMLLDVTERENLENALQKQKDEQQVILDSVPAWIFYKDKENKFIRVNQSFCQVMGLSRDQLEGKSLSEFYPPAQAKAYLEDDLEVIASRKPKRNIIETMPIGKGKNLWVQTDKIPYFDDEGSIIGIIGFSVDITERKNMEDELRNSRENLVALFDNATDQIFTVDEKHNYVSVNNQITKIVNKTAREMVGRNIAEFFPKEVTARFTKNLDHVFQTGKGFNLEEEMIVGKRKSYISTTLDPIKDEKGKVTSVIGIVRDITESKKTEEFESRLAAMVEATSDFVSVADMDGNLLYLNEAGRKMIGLSERTDITKLKIADMHPTWAAKIVFEKGRPTAFRKGTWSGETALLHRDGHEIPVSQVIMAHKDKDGKYDMSATTMHDITERKKIEENLKESEEKFHAMIENSGDLTTIMDIDGKIKYESPAITKIMGYGKDELIGKSAFDLIHKDDLPTVMEKFTLAVESPGHPQSVQFRYRHKNGSWVFLESTGNFAPNIPSISGMVVNSRDITTSKKAEDAVRESQIMLQNIIDLLPNRIFWKDRDLHYLGANMAFAKDAGWKSPNELLGKDDFSMGWKEQAEAYRADDMKVIKSGIPKLDYEEPQTTPKGDTIWLNTNKVPLKDEFGKIRGVLGTYIDVTENKKSELIIKENEERYKALIESAPLCIKWFDQKGNLLSVNKHGKEEHFLTGMTDEEVKNWKYFDCIEPKYHEVVKQSMQRALKGVASEFDMEHVPGTSTGHWCHSNMVPVANEEGKLEYVLFISRDFTAEKKVEEEKNKNIDELMKFKDLTVGRELKMIELKKEIERLKAGETV